LTLAVCKKGKLVWKRIILPERNAYTMYTTRRRVVYIVYALQVECSESVQPGRCHERADSLRAELVDSQIQPGKASPGCLGKHSLSMGSKPVIAQR
jgi:hypothetical protein